MRAPGAPMRCDTAEKTAVKVIRGVNFYERGDT